MWIVVPLVKSYGRKLNPLKSQTNASVNTSKGRAPTPTCVSLAGPPSLAQERDLQGIIHYVCCHHKIKPSYHLLQELI